MKELNLTGRRDPQYICTATREDLLKEVKKYRRLELWGEGFSWYDCKRRGDPVIQQPFEEGGNYSTYVSRTYGLGKAGGYDETFWKWVTPNREGDYSTAIEIK